MFERLSESRMDMLREICSIGAGHAATALSQLTDRRIDLEVPRILFARIVEVPDVVEGFETCRERKLYPLFGCGVIRLDREHCGTRGIHGIRGI